jgi:hypothetical protein
MTRVDADANAQWTRAARRVDPVTAETLGTASDLHRSTYNVLQPLPQPFTPLSFRSLNQAVLKSSWHLTLPPPTP